MMHRLLMVLLLVGLIAGQAGIGATAYFTDAEPNAGNTFEAWISSQWMQTTQADFNAGVLSNVDTSSSPGDVKLAVKSGWYNTFWSRRKPITINNADSSLTDYQVKVNVTYDSDMKPNFDDIRFADADGSTLLSHWRESYTASTSAIFWVKVPSVPSGAKTIYMYYGNPSATGASNGTATFDFFDDFSGDLSKWTIDPENTDNTVYISAGAGNPSPSLRHDPDSSQTKNGYFDTRLITKNYKILDGIIEYEVYLADTARIIHQLGWRVQSLNFENGYCWRVQNDYGDGGHLQFSDGGWDTFGDTFPDVNANVWHTVKEIVSGSNYTGYVDGGSAYSGTDSTKLTADYLVSHVHGVDLTGSSYVLVDNIRVRKYASTEPTTSAGSEQGMYVSTGTIASQVLDTGISGATWNALFWDETTPASTNITFEVRASNTSFLPDSGEPPSWVSVGGTSPVTSGLPSGQYMQWRATLTTSDTSKTPTLQEVTIDYY
jgi:hypothetical protein